MREGYESQKNQGVNGVNSIKKAIDYVKSHVDNEGNKTVIIAHANCPEKADKIKSIKQEKYT